MLVAALLAVASLAACGGRSRIGLPNLPLARLTSDRSVDLSKLGVTQPTVVNLWATWCAPCREELPVLDAAARHLSGRVRFVGIDVGDDPASARRFLDQLHVSFPQFRDRAGDVQGALRVTSLPTTLLVDDGRVVRRTRGGFDAARLERALRAAFGDRVSS
jgi:thiol-disulfide isomerase/thioredoxin